ncbi:hypothetical protein GCM10009780_52180 [Actinomadura alba]
MLNRARTVRRHEMSSRWVWASQDRLGGRETAQGRRHDRTCTRGPMLECTWFAWSGQVFGPEGAYW